MKLFNLTRNTLIADNVKIAKTPLSRLVGLLNRREIFKNEALMITRCQCIHMFFMRFPIDVVFIDKNNVVVGVVEGIKPFQLSPFFRKASCAIELACGKIKESGIRVGDDIVWA